MKSQKEKKEHTVDAVVEYGGSAASSVMGAIVGSTVAGPVGVIGGALAGTLIENIAKKIGKEIKERVLSEAEERKINTVFGAACNSISDKLNSGHELRNDDFFDEVDMDRSTAEEIFEGILFAAQRESEEKKIKYFAKLYANIAFDSAISRPIANQLIKIAEQLTYRQIVILHVIGTHQMVPEAYAFKNTMYKSVSGLVNVTIASEVFELYRMSLLSSKDAILDCAGINPSALTITGYGALLFNLMELSKIETDDNLIRMLAEIVSYLTGFEIKE